MAAELEVDWGECVLEPRADPQIEEILGREGRFLVHGASYFAECPWLIRSIAVQNPIGGQILHLDYALVEFVWLAVSQDNSCRYCYRSHRTLLQLSGIPEARIRRLEQDWHSADIGEPGRSAVDFARRLSRSTPLLGPKDLRPLADAGLSPEAVRELAWTAATAVCGNRMTTLPALPAHPRVARLNRGFNRFLKPFFALVIRRVRRRGKPTNLGETGAGETFAHVVRALDGLPAALAARQQIEDAFASPILSRRCKALVFAVIAHTLGCDVSEQEARRLLANEGLEREDVDEVLAHLASSKLDPTEAIVVPFARETVWYQPIQIQRRVRGLAKQLRHEQLLELIGVVALANAVCRVGFLAHDA